MDIKAITGSGRRGVSFAVPDYGHCYAADIYPSAQGGIIAAWLPPAQATA